MLIESRHLDSISCTLMAENSRPIYCRKDPDMYLERFILPIEEEEDMILSKMVANGGHKFGYIDNPYPCGIFSAKELYELNFTNITIFYGGNGSGKSTLLNLIAQKLKLERISPYNGSEMFEIYADACDYRLDYDNCRRGELPQHSRIITSDDIFDYMLVARSTNAEIEENKAPVKEEWASLKFGETIRFSGMQDYEMLRLQLLSRRKTVSRRQFIQKTIGKEVKLNSNGETALQYYQEKLQNDTLYCLDEPENSMSPKMQLEFVKMLQEMSHYCGCQFIIATHSPFILSMEGSRIYDLDESPVDIKCWWELENTRTYFEFFKRHEHLFD